VRDAIRIDGLTEFTRNLAQFEAALPRALRLATGDAADAVVDYARPRVPRRTGRARQSLRATSIGGAVRLTEGGPRAPYMPWLDFGGRVGRRGSVHRPYLRRGRYLHKGYIVKRDTGVIQKVLSRALLNAADRAGIEVT